MMSTLEHAIGLAVKAHEGQKDKAGECYILHSIRVMMKLDSDQERIVGILHDVVEDTNTTIEDLRREGFTEEVLGALKNLVHLKDTPYDIYIERISRNNLARKVKLADLEDNMNLSRIPNPVDSDYKRLEKYKRAYAFLRGER